VEYLVILLVLGAVVFAITAPLRPGRAREEDLALEAELAELEAAKDAKYREIRDAELDHQTGKLSDADWRAMDRALRAEAVELLKRLDRVQARAEPLP
jgi:flagellar biosynthesis/type III secretory pathway M-ring protein FliF/YscJ